MVRNKVKKESGISLIALVITIIVVIILAAIAFGTSTRTISNANYSDYVNNVGEVRTAFHTRAITVKGQEAAKGNNVTDAQVYNYLARNGKNPDGFVVRADLPDYTIIKDEGQIGMALPKMKIESSTGKMVEVQYVVTDEGEIFTWPPFEYEEKLMVNDKDTSTSKASEDITVGGKSFAINVSETDGRLLDASGDNAGGEGGDTPNTESVTFTLSTDQGESGLDVGDVVTLTNEQSVESFYVVSTNATTTKLLARYGIDVSTLKQTAGSSGTLLAPIKADNAAYWKASANGDYPYDLTGETVSESESEEKQALYAAQAYGRQYGLKGTLLTKYEFDDVSGQPRSGTYSYQSDVDWLKGMYFGVSPYIWWLGTASSDTGVWYVTRNGTVASSSLTNAPIEQYAVRPVLVVSTSSITQ